jgi:hypothetical protein
LRIKKGIIHTSTINSGTVFFKDKIYLEWYTKIKQLMEDWKENAKIYKWKVKSEDLDYII